MHTEDWSSYFICLFETVTLSKFNHKSQGKFTFQCVMTFHKNFDDSYKLTWPAHWREASFWTNHIGLYSQLLETLWNDTRPLMEGIANVIISESWGLCYCFPSLIHAYQQRFWIWPINLMVKAVRFFCTCSVMDDVKSLTWKPFMTDYMIMTTKEPTFLRTGYPGFSTSPSHEWDLDYMKGNAFYLHSVFYP